ncbi:hypothetical protein DOTSEDRAFT_162109 [Dothistroma septosporum NZE10]|uniref:Uncharacterized protein n=1 Tax=Dothistroma septosporum (strain NZE10 / CBS 128990) TaxID=675120 RepID=N1PZV8_DOTSN|nr:hypothetical protein DOTSEDRAFT_162109 [Dothistroma septosporum NZE10]
MEAPSISIPASTAKTPASAASAPTTSSLSTLSSVPTGSQASTMAVSSSSKRTVSRKDGLKGVTNSESDENGSSSDEELADIYTSFAKRRKLSSSADKSASTFAVPTTIKKSARLSVQDKRQKTINALPRSPPRKVFKNSLASLIAQNEKYQLASATIASLESSVDEARKKEERLANAKSAGIDGNALIEAAGSDSDEQQRMIMALERTEALYDEVKYRFFLDDKPLYDRGGPLPEIDERRDLCWARLFQTAASTREACVSGFAAELIHHRPLPASIVRWMTQELFHEPDQTLCEAFVEILRASSIHHESRWDTSASLNSMYKTRSIFELKYKEAVASAKLPPGLQHVVRVAAFTAPAVDSVVAAAPPQSTTVALLDLALMNIDDQVTDDSTLSLTILESIEDMLDSLPEDGFNKLVEEAVGMLRTSTEPALELRCRAIVALPAATPRAYRLRRRLASECFSAGMGKKDPATQDWSRCIVQALKQRPEFQINEETNYGLLLELTGVLDIAISGGWTNDDELVPEPPTGPWNKPAEPTQIERLHNDQMDAICRELHRIVSRVRDAGTTHLRRTQAKTAIEHLASRIEHSVRARPKPRKGVFTGKKAVSFGQARFGARGFTGPGLQTPVLPSPPHVQPQQAIANLAVPQDNANVEAEAGPSTTPRRRRPEQADELVDLSQEFTSSPPAPRFNSVPKLFARTTDAAQDYVRTAHGEDNTDGTVYYDSHSQRLEHVDGT